MIEVCHNMANLSRSGCGMRIGYSQLDSNREFDDRHGKPDLKIGETKSISYLTVRELNCTMFCRIVPYALVMIFYLGCDGVFLMRFCS